MGRRKAKGGELSDGWDEENEEEMSSRDTPERGKGGRNVVEYNLLGFIVSRRSWGHVTRSRFRCGSLPFHVEALLGLDRAVVEGRLAGCVAIFLVALAERLG